MFTNFVSEKVYLSEIEMWSLLAFQLVAFPQKGNELLNNQQDTPHVFASGSLGMWKHGKCVLTYPNETLNDEKENEWCSNIAKGITDMPWISYSFPQKAMRLTGYSIRNGCCYHPCCCDPETDRFFDSECCCELYSFSLQGSNDNHTWKVIHQVEKSQFPPCEAATYEFAQTESFRFVRLAMDQERPGCIKCFQIHQVQLYGDLVKSFDEFDSFNDDNEESVSIIGKVRKY